MKTKSVLIISHSGDITSKFLSKRLEEIGQPYHLVDLGTYPEAASVTIDLTGPDTQTMFRQLGGSFSADDVKSVWWRRPRGKPRPATADAIRKYVELESEIMTNSFFDLLGGVLWVSNPHKTRIANHKPLQLELARKIGFRIPQTLISNDPVRIAHFIRSNSGLPMIMKPVGTSFVRMASDESDPDRKNLAIYTKLVDKKQILENIELVANCPVIFQEAAEQEFDIRTTVVGDSVFSIKIGHTADTNAGAKNVDWRHHDLKRTYTSFQLPYELEIKCVQLVKSLGLNFGAIDLAFSKEKGFVFFEINPQGQWVPSETEAGHPISLTLARLLAVR